MILLLQPIFKEKVWGGNLIHQQYGYDCSDQTGEAWGISAHKNGASLVKNGPYKDQSLNELYEAHPELFGNYHGDQFPILIKVIDATKDLSIQVHPGDDYAKAYENSLGKTECWYILDAKKDTNIIIGHHAKTREEFNSYIKLNDFESIVNKFNIHQGDIFNIHAGTIHAICAGTMLLEIQQSSDVTYRLYDYNRLADGKLRELHLEKAMDVIHFPDQNLMNQKPTEYFDYEIIEHQDESKHQAHQYGDYIFIIEGKGKINDLSIKKGDFLMVSSKDDYHLSGVLKYALVKIQS